jgi:hypothetical protein
LLAVHEHLLLRHGMLKKKIRSTRKYKRQCGLRARAGARAEQEDEHAPVGPTKVIGCPENSE